MNMRLAAWAVAAIVGSVVMWFLAGAWHEIAAVTLYADRIQGEHQGVGIILIAYVILGAIMALMYARSGLGARPWLDGAGFGALIGLLWVFPHELTLAAAHGDPLLYVFQNGAWHLIEQGVGGIVIALIFARLAPRAQPA